MGIDGISLAVMKHNPISGLSWLKGLRQIVHQEQYRGLHQSYFARQTYLLIGPAICFDPASFVGSRWFCTTLPPPNTLVVLLVHVSSRPTDNR